MNKDSKKKRLILLDTHAIIHRAYHALPDFATSKGEPTGALYGLTTMLIKIIKDLKPDYIIACYDLPEPTFRHEAYENYKLGRAKAEDDLVHQLNRSRDILTAFSIPMYDKPGFEADDMLGTIVHEMKKNKEVDIVIASGDMDTLQLVDDKRVQVYTLKKGINDTILYDEKAVEERFGFKPKLLPDYKGLRGDPSDNIIGIDGIGEKTATILIQKFGSIEDMYKKLRKNRKLFLEAGLTERVVKLLEEGEEEALFSKTLAQIRLDAPIDFKLPEKTWRESVDQAMVERAISELEFRSLYERFRTTLFSELEKTEEDKAKDEEISEDEIEKVAIALWLCNSETTNPDKEDIFARTNAKNFDEARKNIMKELGQKKLDEVYEGVELPLVPIVKKMEERGVLIDVPYLKKLSVDYHKELSKIEERIWAHAGGEFNINSPKQLGEVLFDKLHLTVKGLKKTEGGARSTRASELDKLKTAHPIVEEILAHREIQKLLSTYIDTIPPLLDKNNRLHAQFIQTGTTTGRFSSANPNVQNIPIRSELGKNIRRAFIAASGHKLLALDYSQIELRVTAILSDDKDLINIFKDGKDVHASVAAKVFGVSEDKVTSEMRRRAKVINFGIIYGMGINALKDSLGTTRAEAEEFYQNYFDKFPTIAGYLESIKNFAVKNGYTETLFGRRRYFPAIKSPIQFIRASAERMAVNAPIQGTAADIIKIAIRRADDAIEKNKLSDKVSLLLQVHDELVYEVKEGSEREASKIIQEAMESVLEDKVKNPKAVPITVSVSIGNNWGELK
ncbi:MAG: DNA polymerase [Candidatus Paceibacterota bacterium]|jgi:DNA polymerase-1